MKFKKVIAMLLVVVMSLSYINFFPFNDVFASDKAQTTETQPEMGAIGESPPPLVEDGEKQNAPPDETEDESKENPTESTEPQGTEGNTETTESTNPSEEVDPTENTEETEPSEETQPSQPEEETVAPTVPSDSTANEEPGADGEGIQPYSGWGSRDLTSQYLHDFLPYNYGPGTLKNDHIGNSSNGCLTGHVFGDTINDFAICLQSNKKYSGGNPIGTVTASYGSGGPWDEFSHRLKEKLILLLVYGIDYDSGHARFESSKARAAMAMQLVAWEWINGRNDDWYFYSPYSSGVRYQHQDICDIAAELRSLVRNNPDKIDVDETRVQLIQPPTSTGQWLIAITDEAVQERPKTGNFTVTKNISGTGDRSGWRFQCYSSYNNAVNETSPLETAYTNSSGVATFYDYPANNRYYVRESSYQDRKDTTGWVLSTEIKEVVISSGATVSAGSVTNRSPAKISAAKTINPSSLSNSANLQGWVFELYKDQNSAINGTNPWKSATTNSNGYVYFDNIPSGTYYVREAPASRQPNKNVNEWVLSGEVRTVQAPNGATSYSHAGNITNTKKGSLSVIKQITGGGTIDRSNWRFDLYGSEANARAETGRLTTAYTNVQGVATFGNLNPGTTYYIRESSTQDKKNINAWELDFRILQGTVTAGIMQQVGTVTNKTPAQITGKKAVQTDGSTAGKLNDWVFQISNNNQFTSIVKSVKSDSNGNWSTGYELHAGTYFVREAPMEQQTRADKNNFSIDPTIVQVSVSAGQTASALQPGKDYTSLNKTTGKLQVQKGVAEAENTPENLSGWIFKVYSDAECRNLVYTMDPTNDKGNSISKELPIGTYYVKEASRAEQTKADKNYWTISDEVVRVTVIAGTTTNAYNADGVTATNILGKRVKVTKVADNVLNPDCFDQIKDNHMYTTEGAQYEIYVNDVLSETITTGPNGVVLSNKTYEVGTTGYIKEIVAPRGYLLDPTPHPFTIVDDDKDTCDVVVKNVPAFDPAVLQFQKKDKETGAPQGNTSFEGAVFRWEYYDNENWSGNPVRTWYFKTDENGKHRYQLSNLDHTYTNDELYMSANGRHQLPLGSVKITEIVSPVGYKELPVMYGSVKQTAAGQPAKWEWTKETSDFIKNENDLYIGEEPEDQDTLGSLSIEKLDKDYGKTPLNWGKLAGCEFTVYNRSTNPVKVGDYQIAQPGEACYVLVIGEDGTASTGNIFPIGEYEVKETKGNDYYQTNTEWSYSFTIDGTQKNQAFSTTCQNEVKGAKVEFEKINTNLEPIPGAKFSLQYSLDGRTDWKPVFKSDKIVVGGNAISCTYLSINRKNTTTGYAGGCIFAV